MICLTCLSDNNLELLSLSLPLGVGENSEMSYLECYRECIHLEVNTENKLPQFICSPCAEQMRDTFYFIKQAKKSQRALLDLSSDENFEETYFEWVSVEKDDKCFPVKSEDTVIDSDYVPNSPPSSPKLNDNELLNESPDQEELKNEIAEDQAYIESDFESGEEFSDNLQLLDSEPKKRIIKRNQNRSKVEKKIPGDTLVECEICGDTMAKKSLNNHKFQKHKPKIYLCDACPLTFKTPCFLRKHAETHKDISNRPRIFACLHCEKSFMTKPSLRAHLDIHVENRRPRHKCDICGKRFFQSGSLNVHKVSHTDKRVKCELCEKEYTRPIDLKYHMDRAHLGNNPFVCPQCGKSFKQNASFKMHLRVHEGTLYQCDVCYKAYMTEQSLVQHRQVHTGFNFKCFLCEKEFTTTYKTKRHIVHVHKDLVNEMEKIDELVVNLKRKVERRSRSKKIS